MGAFSLLAALVIGSRAAGALLFLLFIPFWGKGRGGVGEGSFSDPGWGVIG